jgi:outer membrane protease
MLLNQPDFDLGALYEAIDEQRRSRKLSWAAATREINREKTGGRPIATSTIKALQTNTLGEGDGILHMLVWLQRTPESFVSGFPDADAERFHLRDVPIEQMLRWDTGALYSALDTKRQESEMSWRRKSGASRRAC